MKADLDTLRWGNILNRSAIVIADCYGLDQNILEHAPRSILKKNIEKMSQMGYKANVGFELEFYHLKQSYKDVYKTGKLQIQEGEDYTNPVDCLTEDNRQNMRNLLKQMDIEVESSMMEAGSQQQELTLKYTDAL